MQLSNSLSDQLAARLNQTEEPLTDASTLARIAGLIEKISGTDAQTVEAGHTPEDLGMGSLDRIELMVRVEDTFGVRIDERVAADLATVGKLSEYVDQQVTAAE